MATQLTSEQGWIPWKQGYGGLARAVRWSNGQVFRIGNSNCVYPVSDKLAKRFKTTLGPHPAKKVIEGSR